MEHLRGIAGELQMADVRAQVALSLFTDFENFSTFKPADIQRDTLNTTLDQVIAWSNALAPSAPTDTAQRSTLNGPKACLSGRSAVARPTPLRRSCGPDGVRSSRGRHPPGGFGGRPVCTIRPTRRTNVRGGRRHRAPGPDHPVQAHQAFRDRH